MSRPPRPATLATTALAALLTAGALSAPPPAAAADGARPRVGLVLGGGGARGAAHVGVLEVLDRLRVPVDCVAGTSMGALVAGAWVAGVSPRSMREQLAKADWDDMFQDNPEYADLALRNKQLARRFLSGTESGFGLDGLVAPPGVVAGQKIKLFFNRLVRANAGLRELSKLPLPLSIVATDIGNGERVVLREGSLTQAMRASMAVPGLIAPIEAGGRRLVDGGIVDNVPIGEVRERCGAEVVIAVNVGSPLLKAEQVSGLLSVSAQMVAILTEQNVARSLATLRSGDIYIQPALDGITAADFKLSDEAAARGRAAAEAQADALSRLALPPDAYAVWLRRLEDHRPDVEHVDEIEIAGLSRVGPETVRRYLKLRPGQPLDVDELDRDLVRAYGDGWYEGVDYVLLNERGRRVLRIMPVEKRWGPDYLRLGVNLDSNLSQGSTYSLRAGYQKTWLNALGGELLASAEIGSNTGFGLEWYQPLDAAQRVFVQASGQYRRTRADVFADDDRIAEYRLATRQLDLVAGVNVGLLGQATLGWRRGTRRPSIETGDPSLPTSRVTLDGAIATLDLDQLDRLHFPTRGWAARAAWFDAAGAPYARLDLDLRGAWSAGDWVLGSRAAWSGSPQGALPVWDSASLGGFLNLSAFASGQLLGDRMRYAQLRAERIVGRLPLGLRGDMRAGLALEAGQVRGLYTETARRGWLDSTTAYLAGETPLGAVYVGVGHSSEGATNAYFFIGTP